MICADRKKAALNFLLVAGSCGNYGDPASSAEEATMKGLCVLRGDLACSVTRITQTSYAVAYE